MEGVSEFSTNFVQKGSGTQLALCGTQIKMMMKSHDDGTDVCSNKFAEMCVT